MQIQVPRGITAMTAGQSLVKEVVVSPNSGFKRTIIDRKDTLSIDELLSAHTPSTGSNTFVDFNQYLAGAPNDSEDEDFSTFQLETDRGTTTVNDEHTTTRPTTGGKSLSLGLNVPTTPLDIDFDMDVERGASQVAEDSDGASEYLPEAEEEADSDNEETNVRPTLGRQRSSIKRLPSPKLQLLPPDDDFDSDSDSNSGDEDGQKQSTFTHSRFATTYHFQDEVYDDAYSAAFARHNSFGGHVEQPA